MLTESEKDWLDRRKKNEKEYGSVFCPYCEQFNPEWDLYLGYCNNLRWLLKTLILRGLFPNLVE